MKKVIKMEHAQRIIVLRNDKLYRILRNIENL